MSLTRGDGYLYKELSSTFLSLSFLFFLSSRNSLLVGSCLAVFPSSREMSVSFLVLAMLSCLRSSPQAPYARPFSVVSAVRSSVLCP